MATATAPTTKTRILMISDTHSTPLRHATATQPFRSPLPSADVLIHCGDMTMKGLLEEYDQTLDTLALADAKLKIVIAGNHDRTLDRSWMEGHQRGLPAAERGLFGAAREMWVAETGRARREGVVLLDEGVHEFELDNGALLTVYASQYQPEFYDWAFPYQKDEDRYNAPGQSLSDASNIAENPVPSFEEKRIDVMVTHGPPWKRLDPTRSGPVGCPHLLRALTRSRPLIHCFGHIHEGWGAEIVHWADDVAARAGEQTTTDAYKEGGWEKDVKKGRGIETIMHEPETTSKERSVFVDVSKGSEREVQRGRQSLLVNAAIMDEHYRPINAPFLVDVDLPLRETAEDRV